jgi:hypothetical protein
MGFLTKRVVFCTLAVFTKLYNVAPGSTNLLFAINIAITIAGHNLQPSAYNARSITTESREPLPLVHLSRRQDS